MTIVVYTAELVIPITAPVIPHGAVAVRDGRVLTVGTRSWVLKNLRDEFGEDVTLTERHWQGVLMPGLINAHTHLQYTTMDSVGQGSYADFHAWGDAFDVVYDKLKSQGEGVWREAAAQGARQLIEAGTSAAADVVTDFEAAGALKSQGLHGIAYWEIMDWSNREWETNGRTTLLNYLGELQADETVGRLGISPHAPYSLSAAPFLDIPDIARRLGMRFHIHLGETPLERGDRPSILSIFTGADWVEETWESYKTLRESGYGPSSVQFVDQLGALGPDVHIAHGIYVDPEDRRLLRQRGVSVALCPRSNRVTGTHREAPVADYLREGNLLSIGTDSLSSSPSLDVLDDCAALYDIARTQGYTDPDLSHRLIRMLTLGGAEAMGLNTGPERIGQINAGALASLAFLDIPVEVGSPEKVEETLERLVRAGGGTNSATVIDGNLVYNEGALHDERI